MSSCLSGGGGAYGLNLELIKPPTPFSASNSSSPSSSLSEPLSISTRKPRTPRKRPNQTYSEAAAILSTAYPKLFPPKSFKLTKSRGGGGGGPFLSEPPDLLVPERGFLLRRPPSAESSAFPRQCRSPGEITSRRNSSEICDEEDLDAESILDEEVEEGVDSIMGNLRMDNGGDSSNYCYGFPEGMGFDFGCGRRSELRAMRNVGGGDWWSSPSVRVVEVTQRIARIPVEKKKKKKKTSSSSLMASDKLKKEPHPPTKGLRLKLNYDDVLSAWSDKGSPFSGESPAAGNDVQLRDATWRPWVVGFKNDE